LKTVRVLVVEDSAFMRRVISDIICEHPDMDVAATAKDGVDALKKIKECKPDVITMDLEMPRMDGIQTMRRIMAETPLPVIMLSSHTGVGSESTLKALDAGAVDFITKPSMGVSVEELKDVLPQKIIAASMARVNLITSEKTEAYKAGQQFTSYSERREMASLVIAIGASTGGPKALEAVFKGLPPDLPAAVMLSQHMPPGFTLSFAQRLDLFSPLKVKEAANGDPLLKGEALVAPGGYHLIAKKNSVHLDSGPRVNFVRPSIDVMLESLASCEQKILVVIMTGMGKDGAAGTAILKKKKSDTIVIAQDPTTALIPSMPEALIKTGLCDVQVSAERMALEIDHYARKLSR